MQFHSSSAFKEADGKTHTYLVQDQRVIQMTKTAFECLMHFSPFDGYDYAPQVDNNELWSLEIAAFQEVCDVWPDVQAHRYKYAVLYRSFDRCRRAACKRS